MLRFYGCKIKSVMLFAFRTKNYISNHRKKYPQFFTIQKQEEKNNKENKIKKREVEEEAQTRINKSSKWNNSASRNDFYPHRLITNFTPKSWNWKKMICCIRKMRKRMLQRNGCLVLSSSRIYRFRVCASGSKLFMETGLIWWAQLL